MPIIFTIAAIVMLLVWLVGSTANAVAIITFLTNRTLMAKQPVFLLLLNLSLADFCICCFGAPILFASSYNGGWPFGQTLCSIDAFSMSVAGITSACTVASIAVKRYQIISNPTSTFHVVSRPSNGQKYLEGSISTSGIDADKRVFVSRSATGTRSLASLSSYISVFFVWMYATAVSLPPLFGWSHYIVERANFSCGPQWAWILPAAEIESGVKYDWFVFSYPIFVMFFGFFLPCLTVVVCYTLLMRYVKANSKPIGTGSCRRQHRLRRLTAAMIATFVSAWLPYAVLSSLSMLGLDTHIPIWLGALPVIWCKLSVTVNPFVYYFTVPPLREAMRCTIDRVCPTFIRSLVAKNPGLVPTTSFDTIHNSTAGTSNSASAGISKRQISKNYEANRKYDLTN